MNKTLVILAAGIGSRFKGGIKQLAKVGINDETIMELSIKDAKYAGFNKVVFIIREELKEDFLKYVIPNIDMEYDFVYQKLEDIPVNLKVKREKPWGTGQALLTLKDKVKGNFVIINADDYYGKEGFLKLSKFFDDGSNDYAMIGFKMKNTIFTNSEVNRGVCTVENNLLIDIKETYNIKKENDLFLNNEETFDSDSLVSMNMWGFNDSIFELFEDEFVKFLNDENNLTKKEFLIPSVINDLIKRGAIKMNVISSNDICTGITYSSDIEFFKKLLFK